VSKRISPRDLVPLGAVATCAYCPTHLVLEEQPPRGTPAADAFEDPWDPDSLRAGFNFATVDHVVARSSGGEDVPGNVVPCCPPCNSSKRDRPLREWRGREVRR
jgi:hypothetical protein